MQNSMKYLATSTMQDVSSITIMPPEPMMEPTLAERFVVHRHVEKLRGHAAAGRSAGLHRLELPPSGMPPPMSKTISRSVMPIGTSIRPVFSTLSGEREHLRALALLRADLRDTTRRRCG